MIATILISLALLWGTASLPVLHQSNSSPQQISGDNELECTLCKIAVKSLQDVAESNTSFEELYQPSLELCIFVCSQLKFKGEYMCPGLVSAYGPQILYVISHLTFDPTPVCQELGLCPPANRSLTLNSLLAFFHNMMDGVLHSTIPRKNLLNRSPLVGEMVVSANCNSLRHDGFTLNRADKPHTKKPVLAHSGKITILQISDIHLDKYYAEGSPTDCGLYFCCRSWYKGNGSAGHYGDYKCDIPKTTLDLLFDALQDLTPVPDFIIYTGDNPPHDVWNETWSSQLNATKVVVDYLVSKFPNTTIYPAIGNHESWPANEYLRTLEPYKALDNNLSVFWEKLVDLSPSEKSSIECGAYYSMKVMDGLRIISFNTDYGYLLNFFSFLNFENPYYEILLEWLYIELEMARNNHEKVIMIGHIPPGNIDNHSSYGKAYLNLTREFSDTIIGHFFGHTHMDQFHLVQDEDGVYGVILVSPAVTTFGHSNPSFRVFTMDTESMLLLGYTQYHLNLTKANDLYKSGKEDEVKFEIAYTTESEYHLKDLSPASWSHLAKEFLTEPTLLDRYYYNRHGRSKLEEKTCDSTCRKQMLCEVNNVIGAKCRFIE